MARDARHAGADAELPEPGARRLPSVERSIMVELVVVLGGMAVGAWAGLSLDRLVFFALGVAFAGWAWLVWRHGLIGYYHGEGFSPEDGTVSPPATVVTKAPAPRLLAPLMLLAAAFFIAAATPTAVGAALGVPAKGLVSAWLFLEGSWNLLLSSTWAVAAVGFLVYGLVRSEKDAVQTGGCLTGLLLVAAVANYVVFLLWPDFWRANWHDFTAPVRTVAGWFD